jgi:hypothetical protein
MGFRQSQQLHSSPPKAFAIAIWICVKHKGKNPQVFFRGRQQRHVAAAWFFDERQPQGQVMHFDISPAI